MNYKQFYEDVDGLFYKYHFNKSDKKNLYNSVEDIFDKCNSFEKELDETRIELENLENEKNDLQDDYDNIFQENDYNLALINQLQEKIDKYEDILKEIGPEHLI